MSTSRARGHHVKIEKNTASCTPFTAACQEPGCDYRSDPSHSRPVAAHHARYHRTETR